MNLQDKIFQVDEYKITVIVPCYNFEQYIKTCIDSILNQKTDFKFQIFIHDDKSTDTTYDIVKNYYCDYSHITITQSQNNRGITNNLKILFDKVKTPYIFCLDGDDYLTDENYLQRAINFLDSNINYAMYCSGYKTLYPDGVFLPTEDSSFFNGLKDDVVREDLYQVNYITFARVFRNYKNLIKDWINDDIHEDWALNSEILKHGIARCERDKCVGIYRITNVGRITSLTPKKISDKNLKTIDLIIKNTFDIENVIVHIHIFLKNENLEQIAFDNIKSIKENGFKVMITSPKKLPEKFYDYIDIFYHDKENQLFKENYKDIDVVYHWSKTDSFSLNFGIKEVQKHGLAVLRSMIKGCEIANINNIKYILRIEFDDILGQNSLHNIKKQLKVVNENKYDLLLIKNIYTHYTDISLHLMIYDCRNFLEIFGSIKNEDDYGKELENLNVPNKSLSLEIFVYLMVERYRFIKNVNVHYLDTSVCTTDYFDTRFNIHQSCFSLVDGVLSDVMYIEKNSIRDKNRVCIACRNYSSVDNVKVSFDVIDKNLNVSKFILNSGDINSWSIYFIEDISNIEQICIKHNDSEYHRKYKFIKSEVDNSFTLYNITDDDVCFSKIELFQ